MLCVILQTRKIVNLESNLRESLESLAAILRFPILAYALPGAPALTAAHVITLSGWNNSRGVKQALVTTLDRHASYL